MYREEQTQTSLLFSQEIFDSKIPKNHILYRIDQEIDFSFVNETCKDMYSPDLGRRVVNFPEKMFRAEIIQYMYNLSDRQLMQDVNLNILYRWFVGYNLDDNVFHWTAPGKFRIALGKEKHKELFDKILDQLIAKGLIKKNENQSTDATHIIADIAMQTTIGVVKMAVKHLLVTTQRRANILMPRIAKELDVEYYIRSKGLKEYKMNDEEKRKTLNLVVNDALKAVWIVELAFERHELTFKKPKHEMQLREAVDDIKKIFGDYIEEVSNGKKEDRKDEQKGGKDAGPGIGTDGEHETKTKYAERKEKGKGRILSTVDRDARCGAKSKDKKFVGYKAHTAMTDGGFITNVEVTAGGVTDDKPALPLAEHQRERHGFIPEKMRGDGAYGSIENRKGFKDLGIRLVAPEKTSHDKGEYPKDRFFYDDKNSIIICPAGNTTDVHFYNKGSKSHVYHFTKEQCGPCPLKQKCTKNDFRTISIHEDYAIQQEAKEYNGTEDYKEDMKMRSHIEPKQAEMKRFHGLTRAKYRGLVRVGIQAIYTAIVVNLKRMATVMSSVSSRPKPAGET